MGRFKSRLTAALVPRDVDAANAALVQLADTLSSAMESAHDPELSLAHELANVAALIELHRASGHDITFTTDAESVARVATVPTRLVQRLVEDVVAVASTIHVSAQVTIRARREHDRLLIALMVATTSPTTPVLLQGLSASHGAVNTTERLSALFDSSRALEWQRDTHNGAVMLEMEIPWRAHSAKATEEIRG